MFTYWDTTAPEIIRVDGLRSHLRNMISKHGQMKSSFNLKLDSFTINSGTNYATITFEDGTDAIVWSQSTSFGRIYHKPGCGRNGFNQNNLGTLIEWSVETLCNTQCVLAEPEIVLPTVESKVPIVTYDDTYKIYTHDELVPVVKDGKIVQFVVL